MKKLAKTITVAAVASSLLLMNAFNVSAAPWGNFPSSGPQSRQPQNSNKVQYSSVTLESSTPESNGTLDLSGDSILLQFSEDISYSSSDTDTKILLLKGAKKSVPVTITKATSSSLLITPEDDLTENSTYKLYVYSLKDSDDLTIKSFSLTFKTSEKSNEDTSNSEVSDFKDIKKDFWAYDAIMDLTKRGVVKGYSDNTFKPDATVTRSEFAAMLTKALGLTATSSTQTFSDVDESSWDYKAVEAAKEYMTGYKTSNGTMYFYGSKEAVREDMAVALVKALGLTVESNNSSLKELYSDYSSISPNLRDYVYTAYINGIMTGSDGKFNPQGSLTRAEAASLLERALVKTEKVTVGDSDSTDDSEKVVVDGTDTTTGSTATDARLKSIKVNGTKITEFSADTYAYNVVLPYGTTEIPTVTASVYDTYGATASITQATALPGYAMVKVTAEDGSTTITYYIYFTVDEKNSSDATLSNVTVNGTAISSFDPDVYSYSVRLAAGTTVVPTVVATANDANANVIVVPAANLPGTSTIIITAEDGTTTGIYTIKFTVAD